MEYIQITLPHITVTQGSRDQMFLTLSDRGRPGLPLQSVRQDDLCIIIARPSIK